MITRVERTRRYEVPDAAIVVSLTPCGLCGKALLEEQGIHRSCFQAKEGFLESAMDVLRQEVAALRLEVQQMRLTTYQPFTQWPGTTTITTTPLTPYTITGTSATWAPTNYYTLPVNSGDAVQFTYKVNVTDAPTPDTS